MIIVAGSSSDIVDEYISGNAFGVLKAGDPQISELIDSCDGRAVEWQESAKSGFFITLRRLYDSEKWKSNPNSFEEFQAAFELTRSCDALRFYHNYSPPSDFITICLECLVYCEQALWLNELSPSTDKALIDDLLTAAKLRDAICSIARLEQLEDTRRDISWECIAEIGFFLSILRPKGSKGDVFAKCSPSQLEGIKNSRAAIATKVEAKKNAARTELAKRLKANARLSKSAILHKMADEIDPETKEKLWGGYGKLVEYCKDVK